MTRSFFVIGSIALIALRQPAQAPTRPDFSGSWTLTDPSGRGAFGPSFIATQDATTLSIEMATAETSMTLGGGGATTVEGPPVRRVFYFNGEDKIMTYPRPVKIDAMDQTRMMWSYLATSSSRAGWSGDQLVIVTHNKNKVHFPHETPSDFDSEQTVQLAVALDADGKLVVNRMIIADPLPFSVTTRVDNPGVWKTTYKKKV
jgi:hypothetical protein